MNKQQIELVDSVNELTAKEKTTVFIDAEDGTEITTRVAS